MRLKKNVFGYINFSIGMIILSVFLYTLFVSLLTSFEEKAGKRLLFMGIRMSNLGGIGLLLLTVLIFFLIIFIKSKIPVKKFKGSALVYGLVYWFSFAFFLAYGFFVRLSNLGVLKKWDTLKHYTESVSKPGYWKILLDLFYGEPVTFDNLFHKVYTYVAALFLKIFGDTLTVPAGLNIFLFLSSAVLLFFSVMFIFGKVPAIFAFGALMLSKAPVAFVFEISGFNMFLFALSVLIFLVTYFLDVFTTTRPVMCYIVCSVALLLAPVFNHFTFKPFMPVFAFDLSILNFRPAESIYVCIAITVLGLFGLVSYFKNKEDEISFANILLVFLLLILMLDYSANNTYLFAIVSFCILAGIGFDNLVFRHYKAVPVAETETETSLDEDTVLIITDEIPEPVSEHVASVEPVAAIEPAAVEEPEPAGVITVSGLVGEKNAPEVKTEEKTPVEASAEKPKAAEAKHVVPNFFEVPIPMPKKHVKKTFEYSFEPESDMMKYDIEISPDDDFDIK